MDMINEAEVNQAFRTLLGDDVNISRDFLYYVQPSGVKAAFRKKAKENHPDFFAAAPVHVQERQTARLRKIIEAYDLLTRFFELREAGLWKPAPHIWTAQPAYRSHGQGNVSRYYKGVMPPRSLVIGKYLYYRGVITFELLVKALMWQREQRPTIGDIAVQWGLLDQEASARLSRLCGVPWLFGEKAVELGLLEIFQVNTIVMHQCSLEPRLGNYFVQNEIFTREEMEVLAREQQEHNAALKKAS